MIVIGVYKRYNHSTKSKNHPRAKRNWYLFFYDEDLRLRTKKISVWLVPYYKIKIRKRKTFVCLNCGTKFLGLVRFGTKFVPCPNGCDDQQT